MHNRSLRSQASPASGITLIELLVTLAIISLIVSIAYPSMTTGIDGIRLRTSVDNIATLFTEARNMSDRFQTPVQITVAPGEDRLHAATIDGVWQKIYELPDRVHIVIPRDAGTVVLFPGSPTPGLRILLEAEYGARTGLRFNIFTGVAEKWEPDALLPEF
ncbi:MAG TPA: prepilin-type N-terminal cleavage/methylation domain-containing protein [Bryobacterales bacterium]|nr:prepilin-type N-terminal cleavage/methylation domain-containing protein [Bryobacterales bacterium]